MATGETVRDWIKTQIEGVTGYNAVYEYAIEIRSIEQFVSAFGTDTTDSDGYETTKGWTIQLIRRPTAEEDFAGVAIDTYLARLLCVWSAYSNNASEVDFLNHVEDVANALTDQPAPAASLSGVYLVGPAQIQEVEYMEYSQRLHHYAIVELPVRMQRDIR